MIVRRSWFWVSNWPRLIVRNSGSVESSEIGISTENDFTTDFIFSEFSVTYSNPIPLKTRLVSHLVQNNAKFVQKSEIWGPCAIWLDKQWDDKASENVVSNGTQLFSRVKALLINFSLSIFVNFLIKSKSPTYVSCFPVTNVEIQCLLAPRHGPFGSHRWEGDLRMGIICSVHGKYNLRI